MVDIKKASGEWVPFDKEKLRGSLRRVNTDEDIINQIVDEVIKVLRPGISTHEIYKIAFRLLREKSHISAGKYHLKRALMHLGSSGYPFEKYFAALLQHQGFMTENNQLLQGYCITHEIDVVATHSEKEMIVECKYHQRQGLKCDVTIALYFKARFEDIAKSKMSQQKNLEGWLVTNTRFTSDAIKYGYCAGLHLISWDYPEKASLKSIIENSGLYPVTCMTNLKKLEIMKLIESNIVLCKSIKSNLNLLDALNLPDERKEAVITQCQKLCEGVVNPP